MKQRLLACTLLTYMAFPAFANQDYKIPPELFLVPEASWARPSLDASQMTVIPNTTGSFIYILIYLYNEFDTGCTGTTPYSAPLEITVANTASGVTTLTGSQSYTTSNASNNYLFNGIVNYAKNKPIQFFFSDDNTSPKGSVSPCTMITTCANATDCGFASSVTWTWAP